MLFSLNWLRELCPFDEPVERIAELFVDPMVPEDGKIKLSDRLGWAWSSTRRR